MVATLYVHAAIFLQSATTSTWSLQSMWSTMSTLPRVVVGILFVLVRLFFRCDDRPRLDVQRGTQAVAGVRSAGCRGVEGRQAG